MHAVLGPQVKPSVHELITQCPEASQLSPSGHVPSVQLGWQSVLGSGPQGHATRTVMHTSPAAQSVSAAHSCRGGWQRPHSCCPGGLHAGRPTQSVFERQRGSELAVVPGQRSSCGLQIESQSGPATVTVPSAPHA